MNKMTNKFPLRCVNAGCGWSWTTRVGMALVGRTKPLARHWRMLVAVSH